MGNFQRKKERGRKKAESYSPEHQEPRDIVDKKSIRHDKKGNRGTEAEGEGEGGEVGI